MQIIKKKAHTEVDASCLPYSLDAPKLYPLLEMGWHISKNSYSSSIKTIPPFVWFDFELLLSLGQVQHKNRLYGFFIRQYDCLSIGPMSSWAPWGLCVCLLAGPSTPQSHSFWVSTSPIFAEPFRDLNTNI